MSSEVGSGHISIFPVMTGFKSAVSKEVKATGKGASGDFGNAMKGGGKKAGTQLGSELKGAFNTASGDLGSVGMSKLKGEVASASAALSKARLKQQDEAGKVRVAETKLNEAMAKYGEGSSQAIAAEERLESARRRQATVIDSVKSASDRLKSAQEALAGVQRASISVTAAAGTGWRGFRQNFQAGWSDANAAASAFTGLGGAVGGLSRALAGPAVSGLQKFSAGWKSQWAAISDSTGILGTLGGKARTVADSVSTSFVSMATKVGGGLSKGWSATSGWLGGVGKSVATGLQPVISTATYFGGKLAEPFISLGTKVGGYLAPVGSAMGSTFSKLGSIVGPHVSSMVSTASSSMGTLVSKAASIGREVGSALGSGIKSAATTGVTVAVAGIGVAFTKGLSRLSAIDTAQAKLKGLGNSADDVKSIMSDALGAVKGTSFGLGEAATVAASAVAAGIKPGEALQGHLKNIANNASAAGMSMDEMGSIFNKAATQANGVQNDVIGQLADKGIPIYQALADQLGVTSGEVFKMASEGKINFETFSAAAQKAAGTVAEEMGKTVPGASKNFMAAMGRIGANALEGVYGKIGPLIAAATSALGPIEEKAKSFGATLTKVVGPAIDWLTNALNAIGKGSESLSSGMSAVLGPAAGVAAALGAGGLAGALGPIAKFLPGLSKGLSLLGGPLGIVAAGLAGLALSGGDVGSMMQGLTGIIGSITSAIPGIVSAITGAIPQIVQMGTQLINGLIQGIVQNLPALADAALQLVNGLLQAIVTILPVLLQGGADLLMGLVQGIVAALPTLITVAVQLVQGLLTGILQALPVLLQAGLQVVMGLLTGILQALPQIIQGAIQLVMALLNGIIQMLPQIIQGAIQLVMSLVTGLVQMLPELVNAAVQLVTSLITGLIGMMPQLIDAAIQLVIGLVTGLIQALPQLVQAAIQLIIALVTALIGMLPQLISSGIQLIVALAAGLVKAVPQLIAAIPQIIAAIVNAFRSMDWGSIGRDLISGIGQGIASAGGQLLDMAKRAVGNMVDGVKSFFGIHSPSRLMRDEVGKFIPAGIGVGIEDGTSALEKQATDMARAAAARAQAVVDGANTALEITANGAGGVGNGGAAGRTVNYGGVTIHSNDADEVWSDLQMREALALGTGA